MSDGGPERIRFCLECGEAMPFDERRCEACGHDNPPVPGATGKDGDDQRPQAPCRACAQPFVATGLFCPQCGAERRPLAVGPAPPVPPEPPGTRGLERLTWALTLAGPLLVAAAVVLSLLL